MKKPVVLVGGATGREHAIARHISANPSLTLNSFLWANNPFVGKLSDNYRIGNVRDVSRLVEFISSVKPSWVLIGQGEAIQEGIRDTLERLHIPCIAPTKEMAKLEGSKSFTRNLAEKLDPSLVPSYEIFAPGNLPGIKKHIQSRSGRYVIKCDAVVSGIRVKIFDPAVDSAYSAFNYARGWMEKSHKVVVEDFIEGKEVAMISIVDGKSIIHSPPFRNYKRIEDGDKGDNTSGMGAVTSGTLLPFMTPEVLKKMQKTTERIYGWLQGNCSQDYRGSLYGEFIVTYQGDLKLIEYNNRFGNPSSMNLLLLMKHNFGDVCQSIVNKDLGMLSKDFWKNNLSTVSAYVVPNGFPHSKENVGTSAIDIKAKRSPYFYCGRLNFSGCGDGWYEATFMNSRGYAFAAPGKNIEDARRKVYKELDVRAATSNGKIHFRTDIGVKF